MTSRQITVAADQGQVDHAMEWLMRLPQLRPDDLPALHEVEATVAALSEPANPTWCMARVAALLSPYYERDTPQAVREMEAEDWLEALAEYPQWAIERAVRWWKSAENEHRRKRPLEGDIAARCKAEMRGIKALPDLLSRKAQWRYIEEQPPRPKTSAADRKAMADAVLEKAGFRLKRIYDAPNEWKST